MSRSSGGDARIAAGSTLKGMVKSYNKRGFGFIMCEKTDQDIYFSRDSLHPQLRTSDLAGEHVQFDLHRFPDGKLQARNLRPLGDVSDFVGERCYTFLKGKGKGQGWSPGPSLATCRDEEDRSRDWYCRNCGERNFMKRNECFKCKAFRQHIEEEYQAAPVAPSPAAAPRRTFSPHAGSRAVRQVLAGGGRNSSRDRSSRKRSSSSSSSSRSSRKSGKRRSRSRPRSAKADGGSKSDAKAKGKARSRSKSSSSSSSSSKSDPKEPTNPEVDKAKADALEKLLKLKEVESKDQRMKEWRTLLREWHPDKNPDRVEVATAVFQFLQKGKQLLEAS
mmetsp:Transcript_33866/g.79183  ORF Transcript_33866/g.79183 Transcript_33866/m.79183 type:complete len:333 (-) Transcript_33866:77-1075(-)